MSGKSMRGNRWTSHTTGREQSPGAVAARASRRGAREQETARRMTAWTARRARMASGGRLAPSRVRTRIRDRGGRT